VSRFPDAKRERYLDEMGLGPVWRLRVRREPPKAPVDRPQPAPRRPAPPRFDPVPGLTGRAKLDPADERAARILRMDWPEMKSAVKACEACGLRKTCKQTVFGVGDEQADWLLVGEAPGAEEDARGEPFVGQAGRLLDMSYRRAWLLVDDMNRCFRIPVVTTQPGGAQGGGAALTLFGQNLIDNYRAIEKQAMAAVKPQLHDLESALRNRTRRPEKPLKKTSIKAPTARR